MHSNKHLNFSQIELWSIRLDCLRTRILDVFSWKPNPFFFKFRKWSWIEIPMHEWWQLWATTLTATIQNSRANEWEFQKEERKGSTCWLLPLMLSSDATAPKMRTKWKWARKKNGEKIQQNAQCGKFYANTQCHRNCWCLLHSAIAEVASTLNKQIKCNFSQFFAETST